MSLFSSTFVVYNLRVRPVIIMFAKAPIPGHVKTRLIPPLSPALAAALHDAFVWDTIERLQSLRDIADVELHTDICTDAWHAPGVSRALQGEGDLGLKMLQALRSAHEAGRDRAMILGTDSPTLPAGHLRFLLESRADLALGPTEDGGYYAIAARRTSDRMFENVPWSDAQTLQCTVAAARACGFRIDSGLCWWDVDTPDDLDRLIATQGLPRHTAQLLTSITKEMEIHAERRRPRARYSSQG